MGADHPNVVSTLKALGSCASVSHRLVNGEGDRLSGLVVDVFAGVVGVSSSAIWVEAFRPEIETALQQELGEDATEIIWRRSDGRLQQDGWKGNAAVDETAGRGNHDVEANAGSDSQGTSGDEDGVGVRAGEEERLEGGQMEERQGGREAVPATMVRELGLEYEVRPQFGQKTGGTIRSHAVEARP